MGCTNTSNCWKCFENLSEFKNDNNIITPINEVITTDPQKISYLIKIQSHYRGMKAREKLKNNEQNEQNEQIEISIDKDEFTTLIIIQIIIIIQM